MRSSSWRAPERRRPHDNDCDDILETCGGTDRQAAGPHAGHAERFLLYKLRKLPAGSVPEHACARAVTRRTLLLALLCMSSMYPMRIFAFLQNAAFWR